MAHQDVRMSSSGGRHTMHQETRLPIETVIINVIYFIFGVIIALIALRFVLLLFGANAEAPFSQLIYGLTAPFMAPFFAVFGSTQIDGSVFEWSALLAIAVYALVAWGLASLVTAVSPRASAGTVETQEVAQQDVADEHAGATETGETYDELHPRGGGPAVHH